MNADKLPRIITDESDNVVYISDPETYELFYLNMAARILFNIPLEADIVGQKCYKLLQGKDAPCEFVNNARKALSLFTSTSPSYLTMQSLDLCNSYLANEFREELAECIKKLDCLKELIKKSGFSVLDSEPLKLTIDASASGYTGEELAEILRQNNAEPEFYDDKFLVLMITPQNGDRDFEILNNIFSALKPRKPKSEQSFKIGYPITKMSVREAVFAESELIAVSSSVGRICAVPTVSCPPAIPIAVSGEEITEETAALFKKYNIGKIYVVKE